MDHATYSAFENQRQRAAHLDREIEFRRRVAERRAETPSESARTQQPASTRDRVGLLERLHLVPHAH